MMPDWQKSFYYVAEDGLLDGLTPLFLHMAWLAFYALSDEKVPIAFLPLEDGSYLRTPASNVVWDVLDGAAPDGSDAMIPLLEDQFVTELILMTEDETTPDPGATQDP